MLHRVFVSISLLLFFWSSTGFTQSYFPEIQKIEKRGKLIVMLTSEDFAPFYYKGPDGKLHGVSVELAKGIARGLDVKVEFCRGAKTYNDSLLQLVSGKADIMLGNVSKTLDRARMVLFSNTYLTLYKTVLVRRVWFLHEKRKYPHIKDPIVLLQKSGAKVGLLGGGAYLEDAKDLFASTNILQYPNFDVMIQDLLQKKVAAILYDDFGVKSYLLAHPKENLFLKGIVFTNHIDPTGIAVARRNFGLQQWLNLYLNASRVKWDTKYLIARTQNLP